MEERDAKNNHGTCWALQAASFAQLTGDDELTSCCRHRFKAVLLPGQMGADGSFPREMDLWKTLKADSDVDEVVRNFFVR